ncbi:DEAD/DEAH box helicase [Olsenella profusa]|uniref:SNF2 helicase associated domain-containing protein n=1 Tax=Olsenella profusa TaxID=138595 RepID=A0ABS2EZR3_9ACTN|nr:DEAD/DEAH box helicase [Olsenella profusa]MBM6774221.1 SNF2 helicase associated domain-containing protein [Olsenella profusa]
MDENRLIELVQNEAALPSTYGRGLALARDGGVISCEASVGALGSTTSITGLVRGLRGSSYHVEVQVDESEAELLDYSCECVAASSYAGMCKHEVALVLEFLARRGLGLVAAAARRPPARTAPTLPPVRALPTSPAIRHLMEDLTERRLRATEASTPGCRREGRAPAAPPEPVELLATLLPARDAYYDDPAWCVKLRVRRGSASYVVKSISALVEACRTGATVTYGKGLSFAHVGAAFSERSRAVVAVLSRVTASQGALFASRWKYQQVGRGADVKELPVSDADVIDLLDALQGSTVSLELSDGPYGSRGPTRQLVVGRGDPEVRTRLERAGDGGYDLLVSGALCSFAAAGRLYVLDEGRALSCSSDYALRAAGLLGALLPAGRGMHVAPADVSAFCRDVLPVLRAATGLDAPAELDELVPPEAAFTFAVGLDDGRVTCGVTVAYGAWEHGLYGPDRLEDERARWSPRLADRRVPARDLVSEYRVMDVVEAYFPGGRLEAGELPGFDEDDDDLLFDLLTRGLAELDALGEVLLSERLRRIEVRDSPSLTVRATVTSGLLDVALDASGLCPQDLDACLSAYRRRQKFVRLTSGDIMRLGEGAAAVDDLATGLGVSVEELAEGVSNLPVYRVPFVDGLLKRAGGLRLSRNDAFRAIVRELDTFSDADVEVPPTLAGVLRPYQLDGFRWLQLLDRLGFGGILADDMGLGKTLQVIAHLLACKQAGEKNVGGAAVGEKNAESGALGDGAASPGALLATTLVVCPASLVYNWMSELERFAPELDAVAVLGTKPARGKVIAAAADHDVLVTSYDLMRRDVDAYAGQRFSRVVLDEAQYIKNPLTKVARAARLLPARTRLALTGTPVENRASELWSIFDFLMPGVLGSRDEFAKTYEGPVEGGDERAAERLRCLVSPFILRRLKADVLADLPEKTESVVTARMSGEQERLYRASEELLARQIARELPVEFRKNKLQVLAELTKLRQICCDPSLAFEDYTGGSAKLDTCLELIAGAVDGGHQVLLFSQFTTMLGIIAQRLDARGIAHFELTGSTTKEERRRLVARFQAGEAPLFLISLRAGGVGLNLTAADVVIHYDPWWNLAAQNQATDRAYRIGQERAVTVFKLICANTIEERIVAMQESKRELAERLISGEGVRSARLSRDDVLALLQGA